MTDRHRAMWKSDGTLAHLGKPSWLMDADLQTLMIAVEDAGFEIYAVGGCVRDTVIHGDLQWRMTGRKQMKYVNQSDILNDDGDEYHCSVNDVDLATNAHPDVMQRLIENLPPFKDRAWKVIPTGLQHGTITAVPPSGVTTFEVTTFRTDVETDGRHAKVAFSDHIEDDAFRRDFTINAFYADRHGKVRDIVGGSADMAARRVRFIGDPIARIEEDYLRILRFFRFTATHGKRSNGIDADGLAACALLAEGLDGIARERIGAEMSRLIMDFDAAPIIGSMEQSGVLNRILPGANVLTFARLTDLEDAYPIEGRMVPPRDLATRLASLGCADVVDRLRLSKADAVKINLVMTQAGTTTPPHELGYRHGYWLAVQCLLLRWASLLLPFDESVLADVHAGSLATFPVEAADLIPIYTGKALGDRLKTLEAAWINSKFSMSKPALLALP